MIEEFKVEQELQQQVIAGKEAKASTTSDKSIFIPVTSVLPEVNLERKAELETFLIVGTPNPETLDGSFGDDLISALGADDAVFGKAGNDSISGGSENDYIEGNAGNDLIYGETFSGNTDLIGIGNDILKGGKGKDSLFGQNGGDLIYGEQGNDFVEGGNNDDIIYGGIGADLLFGDDLENSPGVSGDDTVYGGDGNDQIFGGRANDFLTGQNGNDQIIGGQGNDILEGGEGEDKLIGTETSFFGVSQLGFGAGEIDPLTGGINSDTFVLGFAEAQGRLDDGTDGILKDVVLYSDGNIDDNGTRDYALIKDFGFDGDHILRGVDRVQLAGSESMYSLGASPIDDISGTGIFFNGDQNTPELIGILEGISSDSINLSDNNQFIFV